MERFKFIDIARFIGIFLMVLCHAGMHNTVTSVIYAFHMPLFFFLSGYLYHRGEKKHMPSFLPKESRTLLLPYIIFALILCFGKKNLADWPLLIYASRDSIFAAESFSPLWFLPCFFLSTIVFSIINNVTRKSNVLYWVLISGIVVLGFLLAGFRERLSYGFPLNADVALVGVGIMFIGQLASGIKLDIKLGGVLLMAGIILSFLNLPESLTEGNPHVEMSISSYGNPLVFLFVSSVLCKAIIIISEELEKRLNKKLVQLMVFYGSNTITVLCVHGIIVRLFNMAFKTFGLEGTLVSFIITLICFVILYPIIKFINKEMPCIVGRKQ